MHYPHYPDADNFGTDRRRRNTKAAYRRAMRQDGIGAKTKSKKSKPRRQRVRFDF